MDCRGPPRIVSAADPAQVPGASHHGSHLQIRETRVGHLATDPINPNLGHMFADFTPFRIATSETEIAGITGGSGPPLLLLHGYPQTHVMWHRIAPALAERFTVVAADLRGYGASGKPPTTLDHAPYSKRAMAQDMLEVMAALGFDRFDVVAHDRGARVTHRMALDWPEFVERAVILDIAPTREMYALTDEAFARAYWHWFFLIRPAPMPETLIGADPQAFLMSKFRGLGPMIFSDEALAAYVEAFTPDAIHASCEDYRAAASIDIDHDNADGDRKVSQPLLVLWGRDGVIARCFDPLMLWRQRARDVRGRALPGGHYLAEEYPDEVLSAVLEFLG